MVLAKNGFKNRVTELKATKEKCPKYRKELFFGNLLVFLAHNIAENVHFFKVIQNTIFMLLVAGQIFEKSYKKSLKHFQFSIQFWNNGAVFIFLSWCLSIHLYSCDVRGLSVQFRDTYPGLGWCQAACYANFGCWDQSLNAI